MGYTTNFNGAFAVSPPLKPDHAAYLRAFAETRRMQRDPEIAVTLPDPLREAVGLPIGDEGGYFVGGSGLAGQDLDDSVLNGNHEPRGQPGLWCQWRPDSQGIAIEWDGVEKFYEYEHWLRYLIRHFLTPWGYRLRGAVGFEGEDSDDVGTIYVDGQNVELRYHVHPVPPAWYDLEAGPTRDELLIALDEVENAGRVVDRDLAALRRLVERHA